MHAQDYAVRREGVGSCGEINASGGQDTGEVDIWGLCYGVSISGARGISRNSSFSCVSESGA